MDPSHRLDFSLLIPFRGTDQHRTANLDWCLRRWNHFFPGAETIVADSTQDAFNRSEARNNAARMATRDLFVIADADVVFDPAAVEECLNHVASTPRSWAIPYRSHNGYYRLTRTQSARLLARPPSDLIPEPRNFLHNINVSYAGIQIVPRIGFEEVRPWREEFIGWGAEDFAAGKLTDLLWAPKLNIESAVIIHLWHSGTFRERQGQPFIDHNVELGARLIAEAEEKVRAREVMP